MKELIGVIIFMAAVGIAMFSIAPTHQELSEMPDKPLTVEQWNYYGLNQ